MTYATVSHRVSRSPPHGRKRRASLSAPHPTRRTATLDPLAETPTLRADPAACAHRRSRCRLRDVRALPRPPRVDELHIVPSAATRDSSWRFAPAASTSRLPAAPSRTIGRDDDVRAAAERLRRDHVRLLTLTGPGGVGKTRLALDVARDLEGNFGDGAWFVSMASIARLEHLVGALADAGTWCRLRRVARERGAAVPGPQARPWSSSTTSSICSWLRRW